MISATPVIAALKAAGTPFKLVGGAADVATASDTLRAFPAAYVLPLQDVGGENRSASYMAVAQQLIERFGVLYVVRAATPDAGAAAQEAMRLAIDWARSAVVGLLIDPAHDLVQFQGGELVAFADGLLIYLDRWATSSDLRKA